MILSIMFLPKLKAPLGKGGHFVYFEQFFNTVRPCHPCQDLALEQEFPVLGYQL